MGTIDDVSARLQKLTAAGCIHWCLALDVGRLVVPSGRWWCGDDDVCPHRDDDIPNTIGEVDGPIVVRVHSPGVGVPDCVRALVTEPPIGGVVEGVGAAKGDGPPNCQ